MLELIEVQDRSITRLEVEIERHLSPFEEEIERCEQIDFSEPTGSLRLDGGDRNRSRTFSRCFAPESPSRGSVQARSESAGKRLSGRARKGNRYLRAVLVQAAHGVRRSRTYLGEQYRRLNKRRGSKRAALAVGHSILVMYYQMMKTGEEYHEKGEAFFARKDQGKVEQQLVRRLERMGYQVTRPSQPVA